MKTTVRASVWSLEPLLVTETGFHTLQDITRRHQFMQLPGTVGQPTSLRVSLIWI
jgi:hypothetical protein